MALGFRRNRLRLPYESAVDYFDRRGKESPARWQWRGGRAQTGGAARKFPPKLSR